MCQLHPVFNVVKLTTTLEDPIPGHRADPPPPLVVIDGEEQWEVEELLDSHWHCQKLQYLVKWKGFGHENNSWEDAANMQAPECVVRYHKWHRGAPRHIQRADFNVIFQVRSCCYKVQQSWRGSDVRGPSLKPQPPLPTTSKIPLINRLEALRATLERRHEKRRGINS